jgi:hypothetical protein
LIKATPPILWSIMTLMTLVALVILQLKVKLFPTVIVKGRTKKESLY